MNIERHAQLVREGVRMDFERRGIRIQNGMTAAETAEQMIVDDYKLILDDDSVFTEDLIMKMREGQHHNLLRERAA